METKKDVKTICTIQTVCQLMKVITKLLLSNNWNLTDQLETQLIPPHLVGYVKSVRIRSYSGPYFPTFGLNTERYGVSLRIQSEWGKIRTRITPNTDTFYAVVELHIATHTSMISEVKLLRTLAKVQSHNNTASNNLYFKRT